LQDALLCGKILSVKDGFIVCPVCRKKMHGIRVTSRSQAANIQIKCETCKNAYSLIIDSGRCFDSQRPV
jgi:uncharacterized Zn finger protein (UPF0148 family)